MYKYKLKITSLIMTVLLTTIIFTGCLIDPASDTATPTEEPEGTMTAAPETTIAFSPTPTSEPTPTLVPTATPAPTPTPMPTPPDFASLPTEDLGAANYTEASDQLAYISANLGSDIPYVEEYCAYIEGKSMAMDGQTDIVFNYVEWLSNPEATAAYLEDHLGASPDDYEFIEYVGYIRDVDPGPVVLRTSPDTRYFLNRPLLTSQIGEVDYDEFRDWLFPFTDDAFVIVCVVDGVVARVEWIYMP